MKKIIMFGAGKRIERLFERGVLPGDNEIVVIVDNDSKKWGDLKRGIQIVSPDDISKYAYDEIWISTDVENWIQEIRNQLITYGISVEKIKETPKDKHQGELDYWVETGHRFSLEQAKNYYEKWMLAIAGEENDSFWKNKVVADFGCGPCGSLYWTKTPMVKIGIDVLANKYLQEFGEDIIQQDMIYVTSTENHIPIPDTYVDYLCTMNSLDHVSNLEVMCGELLRILKPGGVLIASFQLQECVTECEPQVMTEEMLKRVFLKHFTIESYRLGKDYYELIENKVLNCLEENQQGVLWVRAVKK